MDRREPTFTLDVLDNVLASARSRDVDLRYVNLLPEHYVQLQEDIEQRLGLQLPPVDSDLPVIVRGVQLVVWRLNPDGKTAQHAPGHSPSGG